MNVAVAQAELTPSASARISEARAWEPDRSDWRAWHIFIHDPAMMDRFVATALAQMLGNLPEEASGFFIRYWENGPHIRLRLRGLTSDQFQAIGEALQAAAAALAAQSPPREQGFGEGMRYDSWHPDPANLPWFDAGSVLEIMYEPEWRRYGGRHGMGVHERLFVQSSRQVVPVVAATHASPGKRTGLGLALTAAAVRITCQDDQQFRDFLMIMAQNWTGFVPDQEAAAAQVSATLTAMGEPAKAQIRNAMSVDRSKIANPVVAKWAATLSEHFAELNELGRFGLLVNPATGVATQDEIELTQALQNMMFSQIHMHNNRLGILPQQEFQLAHILLRMIEGEQ